MLLQMSYSEPENSLVTMLCLFAQDFHKYYTKAGMDTDELEVGVLQQLYQVVL